MRNRTSLPVRLLLLVVVLAFPALSGCAKTSGTTTDTGTQPAYVTAMQTGETLRKLWSASYEEYVRLHDAMPARAAWMEQNVAPVLDRAQDAIVVMRQAAQTWAATQTQPEDWPQVQAQAFQCMGDALNLVKNLTQENAK